MRPVAGDPDRTPEQDAAAAGIVTAEQERAEIRAGGEGIPSSPALLGDRREQLRED